MKSKFQKYFVTKALLHILFAVMLGGVGVLGSCIDDDSNSVLNDIENQYGKNTKIELDFDTLRAGVPYSPFSYKSQFSKGDTVQMPMLVKYAYPERLRYTWVVVPYANYKAQTYLKGNKQVYYQPDTIGHSRDLEYIIDLESNTYQIYLIAEDTISGLSASYACASSYMGFSVLKDEIVSGLYLLCETADGNTDIEVFSSDLMLIYNGLEQHLKYYTSLYGAPLKGKPRFISASVDGKPTSKNTYIVATDKNLYRLNSDGLVTMDEWNDMFYETPATFNPQSFFYTNNCEFLINDGKLYTQYVDKANSRKFSAPIAGDAKGYEAFPFLMYESKASWKPVANAIDADMVIYDRSNARFIPYFNHRSSMSSFASTNGDAYLDANRLPAEPKAIINGYNNTTYCIIPVNDTTYLYRYNFYNCVDNGDLSADGDRSVINLSGCTDIENARYFASCTAGPAFYYSSGSNVYSFSPMSGKITNETVYICEPGEEVTALFAWGSSGGGWPTSSVILWIATWNEAVHTSKLIQFEVDHTTGRPDSFWGPMFGAPDNPVVTTGWQKIRSMISLEAQ